MADETTKEPVLCYVEGQWAYFTTCELSKQWGDDWDDAPYEHNAGNPYAWDRHASVPRYELVRVAWDAQLDPPCEGMTNSPYSVQHINAGVIPWLRKSPYSSADIPVGFAIWAGTPLSEFYALIKQAGGSVYLRQE